jgi:hypothetical protein
VRQLAAAFLRRKLASGGWSLDIFGHRRKLASGGGSSKLETQKRQQAAALQSASGRQRFPGEVAENA